MESLDAAAHAVVTPARTRAASALALNLDTPPERDAAENLFRRFLRVGVIPRGILIPLAVDEHVVVAGCALPRTECVTVARLQELAPDRVLGKVNVAFDDFDPLRHYWRVSSELNQSERSTKTGI